MAQFVISHNFKRTCYLIAHLREKSIGFVESGELGEKSAGAVK
jgi:hypothetical protein